MIQYAAMGRISHTQIVQWKRCPRRWYYRYQVGLEPIDRDPKLDYGAWVHHDLAILYRALPDGLDTALDRVAEAHEAYGEELMRDAALMEQQAAIAALGTEVLEVVRRYARRVAEADAAYRIYAVERSEVVDIPNTAHSVEVVTDLILSDATGRSIWIVDHKVTDDLRDDMALALELQFGMYAWAYWRLGYDVRGVVYNGIRRGIPRIPRLNRDGTVSRQPIATDWDTYAEAIRAAGGDPADYDDMRQRLEARRWYMRQVITYNEHHLRQIEEELIAAANELSRERPYYSRTMMRACEWDCPYLHLCVGELKGADTDYLIQEKFRRTE